jgi:hypothetical protein
LYYSPIKDSATESTAMKIGYIRVSKDKQTTALQEDAINEVSVASWLGSLRWCYTSRKFGLMLPIVARNWLSGAKPKADGSWKW